MQTKEQILEVLNTWKRPIGLIVDGEVGDANGRLLTQCILQDFGGVFSHTNLDAAVAKLGDRLAFNVRVVEKAPTQTQEQVNKIFREWVKSYAPKNLILDGTNGTINVGLINTYVKDFFAGMYSITSLSEAANNAEGLKRVSPADLQAAQEQKERDRMAKDIKDSFKPQKERDFVTEVNASVTAEKNRKEQASASADADNVIESYIANHPTMPGRQDFSLTDTRKAEMRAIKAKYKDKVEGLKAVREKKMSYPG